MQLPLQASHPIAHPADPLAMIPYWIENIHCSPHLQPSSTERPAGARAATCSIARSIGESIIGKTIGRSILGTHPDNHDHATIGLASIMGSPLHLRQSKNQDIHPPLLGNREGDVTSQVSDMAHHAAHGRASQCCRPWQFAQHHHCQTVEDIHRHGQSTHGSPGAVMAVVGAKVAASGAWGFGFRRVWCYRGFRC